MTPIEWVTGLAARGITAKLRGKNRVGLLPGDAYKKLTDEEVLFWRHNREAIKDAIRDGFTFVGAVPAAEAQGAGPEAQAATPEIPEQYRRVIDGNTPAEIARRNAEATAVMMAMLPYGHWSLE